MTYPDYIREKARSLRLEQQLSLDEITERLALPRATIHYWIRDIPLQRPRNDYVTPAREAAWARQSDRYRAKREAAYAQGVEEYPALAVRPTFTDFVVLYIAEGYKRSRHCVQICNSDPEVLVLATRWMRDLTDWELHFSVQFHADQDPEMLRQFWSAQLGFEAKRLRLLRKSNSAQLAKRVWRCEHGVLAVSAYDTMFRARLRAWVDLIKQSWQ